MKIFKQVMDPVGLGSCEKHHEEKEAPDGTGRAKIRAQEMYLFGLTHTHASPIFNFR
jgi:hypothetical protein